jgi:hypothetical protein
VITSAVARESLPSSKGFDTRIRVLKNALRVGQLLSEPTPCSLTCQVWY